MNEKGRGRFMQGLCPYGASRLPRDLPPWRPIRMRKRAREKERPPREGRPIRLGPATTLDRSPAGRSLPSVALSSGRANAFYTEGNKTQEIRLTRNTPPATLG
jgi:hypothetical protein